MKRSLFLKQLASIYASMHYFLVACSKTAIQENKEKELPLSAEEENYRREIESIGTEGYKVVDGLLSIDLGHDYFKNLQNKGEFVNFYDHGLLLLRVDEEKINAFDHCCPHRGTIGSWTYDKGKFRCGTHGYQFSTVEGPTVFCNSDQRSGKLKSFPTTLYKTLLTVSL